MSDVQSPKSKVEEDISEDLSVVDGELLEVSDGKEITIEKKKQIINRKQKSKDKG